MKRVLVFACLAAAISVAPRMSVAQELDPVTRKALIMENIKFNLPQLEQYSLRLSDLEESGIPGVQKGQLVINNQQAQNFLVTSDNKQFYFVGEPIDASLTMQEIAALVAEREAEALEEAKQNHAFLTDVLAEFPVKGNPDAPITIIEFSDFQCPYCARALPGVRGIMDRYPEEVKLLYVEFPLESLHPWARSASVAALCAADQSTDAYWSLHDAFFANQGAIDTNNVLLKSREYLTDTGIDMAMWSTCAEDTASEAHQAAQSMVTRAQSVGQQLGLTGTPGFFVNGRFYNGVQSVDDFEAHIAQAKADAATP